jgi:hypothetical protein
MVDTNFRESQESELHLRNFCQSPFCEVRDALILWRKLSSIHRAFIAACSGAPKQTWAGLFFVERQGKGGYEKGVERYREGIPQGLTGKRVGAILPRPKF